MKIAVIGGSGKTGIPFVKIASKEFKMKLLLRNPEKFPFDNPNLEKIKGDASNYNDIEVLLQDVDVVVSLIGHVKGSPKDLQTNMIRHVIDIMTKKGIRRLISLTGGGVRTTEDKPAFMDKLIVFIMRNLAGKGARHALLDGMNHAHLIKTSNLDWTVVRGPMLTLEPAKGITEVGNVGKVKGFKLTREDLAIFITNIIKNNSYIHQMPFVTNG